MKCIDVFSAYTESPGMRLKNFSIGAVMVLMIAPFLYSQLRLPIYLSLAGGPPGKIPELSSNISHTFYKGSGKINLSLQNHESNEFSRSRLVEHIPPPRQDSQLTKFKMKKSPLAAVLLSAALPGAGQFYNQSYWKIPIIGGLVGYFGYEYVINNNKFKDYRDQYNESITSVNPFGDENLKTLREFYRNQRDDFVWYFIIVYVVNLVDAYVDAQLFDFDIKEEKIIGYGSAELKMNLKINF
jgi:hypothetical protein